MENFDRENIDELLEICQIRQYFPRQNFALYGICIALARGGVTNVLCIEMNNYLATYCTYVIQHSGT